MTDQIKKEPSLNFTQDILDIFNANRDKTTGTILNEMKLVEHLVMYVVRRDALVFEHGVKVGKETKNA